MDPAGPAGGDERSRSRVVAAEGAPSSPEAREASTPAHRDAARALRRCANPRAELFATPRLQTDDKGRLVRAIDRSRGVVGLRRVLKLVGLSPSRLHAWRTAALECALPDQLSCPAAAPHQLTMEEVSQIRQMVKDPEFRHVPTGRLAILAQRMSRVFAFASSTWLRLVREHGWRRPRARIHPEGPKVGIVPARTVRVGSSRTPLANRSRRNAPT